MTKKSIRRCSVCNEEVLPKASNPSFPFCNERCRQIDLGKWLGGEYVISQSLFPAHLMPPTPDDE